MKCTYYTGSKISNENKSIFYINFGERNQKCFDKNDHCAHFAGSPQHIDCNARKDTCFISEIGADIYNHGQHTCKAKDNKSSRITNHLLYVF